MGEHSHPHSYPEIETVTGSFFGRRRNNLPIEDEREIPMSEIREKPVMWRQLFATFAATMGSLVMGTTIGWSGPGVAILTANDTYHEFPVTKSDQNLIASMMTVGALIGGLVAGTLMDKFGRKGMMIFDSAIFSAGFLLLVAAQNVAMLVSGRFVSGLATGIASVVAPTFVSETVSPEVRGFMGSCPQTMVTIGIVYVDLVGYFKSWRYLSLACIVMALLWGFILLFVAESPVYYLNKKDYNSARKSLEFSRGHPYVEAELQEIQQAIEEAAQNNASAKDLLKPWNLKPLMISSLLMFGQQFCGINAVIFFSVKIFEAAKSKLNSFIETIIVAVAMMIATIFASLICDRLGRRVLLFISSIVMAISAAGLGIYFYYQAHDSKTAAHITWLPLVSLCLFVVGFSVGYGPIPWLMMSELFAPEVKGIASSLAAGFNWSMAFIITQFYVPVETAIGADFTFWGFAGLIVVVFLVTIVVVPETRGKSLEDIQRVFRGNSSDTSGLVSNQEPVDILDPDVTFH